MSGVVDFDPGSFEQRDPQRDQVLAQVLDQLDHDRVVDSRDRTFAANARLSALGLALTTAEELSDVQQRRAVRFTSSYFSQQRQTGPARQAAWLRRWRRIVAPALREHRGEDRLRVLEEVNLALSRAALPRVADWVELSRLAAEASKVPEEEAGFVPDGCTEVPPEPAPEPVEQPGARTPSARHRRRDVVLAGWKQIAAESGHRYPVPAMDDRAIRDAARLLDRVNRLLHAQGAPTLGPELLDEDLEALGVGWVRPATNAVNVTPEAFSVFAEQSRDPVEEALRHWRAPEE